MNGIDIKEKIISAGYKAVEQLIKVAEEVIIKKGSDEAPDIAADRLKNAAATKKVAIFDAFEILARIEAENQSIKSIRDGKKEDFGGFAERRAS